MKIIYWCSGPAGAEDSSNLHKTDGPNPQITDLYDMDVSLLAHTYDFMGGVFQ